MKAVRKEFQHPAGYKEVKKDFWGWNKPECPAPWIAKTLSEVRQEVADFVTGLGPDKVISVSEHTSFKTRHGDDGITHFVIWHWEPELPSPETI